MSDGAQNTGATPSLPAPPSRGKLPDLRSRGNEREDPLHPVRAEERTPFIVGDRVTLVGEVVVVSTVGSPWIIVRLDGAREPHTVACWPENATQHKRPAKESK